jgi:predicted RND superfamily exporter protein
MPIAVLDSVHILSEFFDRYPQIKDRRRTTEQVMQHLFQPMLFTTLTTIAGFASLALTPIPPVQVFGIFIALGVLLAWFWTIIFIPAFIMFIPEHKLARFGHAPNDAENVSSMNRRFIRQVRTFRRHRQEHNWIHAAP